jgi:hypothetical protein
MYVIPKNNRRGRLAAGSEIDCQIDPSDAA